MILDFAQDTDDRLRFRTNVFPDEYLPVIFVRVNDEAHKSNYHHLQILKKAKPRLRKAINNNSDSELFKTTNECVLNVLRCNVALTTCQKEKLQKFKFPLRSLADKRVTLSSKKRLIIQRGGYIIPLLSAILPTIAGLIFGRNVT
jgi:hypothetical protein